MREVMRIVPPIQCPSCSSELIYRNDQLYCINDNCEAKSFKQVEHFAKTLKIKGLGPVAIEKLNMNSIEEIYELSIEYITLCLKSAKLAVSLFEQIQQSKSQSLNVVLPAFGIPLIGKTASDKLSKVCSSIFDIDEANCRSAGLGEKATSNLMKWLDNFHRYEHLPFSFEFESRPVGTKEVVCISGKLSSFKTKAEATEILEGIGYIVKDTLTKDVTILVNESGRETDKTQKARESGITIINNLGEFINDYNS